MPLWYAAKMPGVSIVADPAAPSASKAPAMKASSPAPLRASGSPGLVQNCPAPIVSEAMSDRPISCPRGQRVRHQQDGVDAAHFREDRDGLGPPGADLDARVGGRSPSRRARSAPPRGRGSGSPLPPESRRASRARLAIGIERGPGKGAARSTSARPAPPKAGSISSPDTGSTARNAASRPRTAAPPISISPVTGMTCLPWTNRR